MNIWLYTIAANLFIWILMIIIILTLAKFRKFFVNYIDYLIAFIWGILSGIIFLGFFPKIFSYGLNIKLLSLLVLVWVLFSYLIELFFHFHHCKDLGNTDCIHRHFSDKLMLIWTFIHNFLHWIILYSAFLVDIKFWITLTIAIFFHSIPQNIWNFLMNRWRLKFVILAAVSWVLGAIFLYPFQNIIVKNKIYILAFVSWMLLYIVISDILPEFKKRIKFKSQFFYLCCRILGILFFVGLEYISKIILW